MTNAELAYQEILRRIIKAEFSPGSVVNEIDLMQSLGFGRTPVREALKRLEVEKFLVVIPRRGMFIAPITYTEINRIYEVRVELEGIGARIAAERRGNSQVKEMGKYLEEHKDLGNSSIDSLIDIDRHFHFMLYDMVHNAHLVGDLQRYYYRSQRIWFHCYDSLEPDFVGLADHLAIFEAIKEQNSILAEERMRVHIMNFQNYIKEYLF